MIEINSHCVLDLVPVDPRRRAAERLTWQVIRADDGDLWLPGDRFTLFRVGQTKTFRLEHRPIALNRLRARFRETYVPLRLVLECVAAGDWITLDSSTMQLVSAPVKNAERAR